MKVREAGYTKWNEAEQFLGIWDYTDSQKVAERYAEYLMRGNKKDPRKFKADIEVMDDDGVIRAFEVTAEPKIIFFAMEK